MILKIICICDEKKTVTFLVAFCSIPASTGNSEFGKTDNSDSN